MMGNQIRAAHCVQGSESKPNQADPNHAVCALITVAETECNRRYDNGAPDRHVLTEVPDHKTSIYDLLDDAGCDRYGVKVVELTFCMREEGDEIAK